MNNKYYFLISLALMLLYWIFAAYIAVNTPLSMAVYLFSETGPYEAFSPWLWFLLAVLCLPAKPLSMKTRLAAGFTAFLLGLREMDLHRSLFEMSFLKSRFYFSSNISVPHKMAGLVMIALLLMLAVYLGKTFYRSIKAARPSLPLSRLYILLSLGIFVVSKLLDRLNAQLNALFSMRLSPQSVVFIQALEESSEMLVPIILCVALLLYRKPSAAGPYTKLTVNLPNK